MPDPRREVQDLDTRLTEIDRKLREIQAELAPPEGIAQPDPDPDPGAGADLGTQLDPPQPDPPQPAPESEPPPDPLATRGRTGPLADVLQHAAMHPRVVEDRLGRRIEELAGLQADLLVSLRDVLARFEHTIAQPPRAAGGELTVSAGPFTSIEAVRAFERELGSLPGVRAVVVRGYEGVDRAVFDVQLG